MHQRQENSYLDICKNRIMMMCFIFCILYLILAIRLFELSISNIEDIKISTTYDDNFFLNRANILDRRGELIATNLITASAYANPSKLIDRAEATLGICKALEYRKNACKKLRKLFNSNKSFVWIQRHLTPLQEKEIRDLGIPGVYFSEDQKRYYPQNNLFSHVLGYVDIDNNGLSGIEKSFDAVLKNSDKLSLSLDIQIQHIVRDELTRSVNLNQALGGAGIVMDVTNGEVLAMVSLPDFNLNSKSHYKSSDFFNRSTLGVYEMGSTFKIFTTATGLDSGKIKIANSFNIDHPLKLGKFRVTDYKGKGGDLSVPEILMYSSNIGTGKMARKTGIDLQKQYLQKFGFLSQLNINLPEKATPMFPRGKAWNDISSVTISYGHGMAVTPLHTINAFLPLVNGGILHNPKLVKNAKSTTEVIIKKTTSDLIRKLLRLIAVKGYSRKANVKGYLVGGKTGTAEKLEDNRYNKKANIAYFIGGFPMNDPRYAVLVMIDEGQRNAHNKGFTTGGMIAAPVAGKIIRRLANVLGIEPQDESDPKIKKQLFLKYTPMYKGR